MPDPYPSILPQCCNWRLPPRIWAEEFSMVPTEPKELCCRLCGGDAPTRISHVFPKLAYKEAIKPDGHPKMIVVRANRTGHEVDKSQQTGFTEKLLCDSCERKLSKWETYASNKLWNFPFPPPQNDGAGGKMVCLLGLQYKELKLFLLSLVWRASVSSDPFFRCVNLGPHEERVRKMLNEENPGAPDEYGCAVFQLEDDELLDFRHMVFEPFQLRIGHQHFTLVCFRGYVFLFLISAPLSNEPFAKAWVTREGNLTILERNVRIFQPLCKLIDKGIRASRAWTE